MKGWLYESLPLDSHVALVLLFSLNSIPVILSVILFVRAWRSNSPSLVCIENHKGTLKDARHVEQHPEKPAKVMRESSKVQVSSSQTGGILMGIH